MIRSVQDARALGEDLFILLEKRKIEAAYEQLAPLLSQRISFRLLDIIGSKAGKAQRPAVDLFLDRIAAGGSMGGWVVMASALTERLPDDLADAFTRTHDIIITAGTWYTTDIFGERVPGPALLLSFEPALQQLQTWQTDENAWVRRIIGVAVHFWAKRTRGAEENITQARQLLDLLDPLYEEKEINAIKGVGWGLKTLGRYYPNLLTDWLEIQLAQRKRRPRALMNRKAITYLPQANKERVCEAWHIG